jgi:hypothetical protein
MDSERERIIEKALKIRELANRGVDGEKSSAMQRLKEYLEKYDITNEELNSFINIDNDWWRNLSKEERGGKFANWFKRSVTTFRGKPMIFFHISRSEEMFFEFDHNKGDKLYGDGSNYGFHFVNEEDKNGIRHIGQRYLFDKYIDGVEFLVYLKMLNPYYIYAKMNGECYGQNGEPRKPIVTDKNLADFVLANGYDSVIIQSEGGRNIYIVYHPNQIKSVNNNGEYSTEVNNIMC